MKNSMSRLAFVLCCLLLGCSPKGELELSKKDEGLVVENSYAEGFQLVEFDGYTEIRILDPVTQQIDFVYHFGESDVNGVVHIPESPSRVIALSSTHIGMLESLGLTNYIVGVSDEKYVCSFTLLDQLKEGAATSLGDIGSSDIEGYLAADPDIVLTSGFDNKAPILGKLKSAGLKLFTNYDWKETHPLGRAEWIKVFGVLFHKRKEADELFDAICSEYLAIKEKVKAFDTKPTILVGTMYGDIFNAPAGESYMAQLLEDANVDYVYASSQGVGSITLTLEEVITMNRSTDYWLNPAAKNHFQLLEMNARFELLKAVQQGKVFSYFEDVNCFWEESAIHPERILNDLCKIFYPELFDNKEMNYYSKLAQ